MNNALRKVHNTERLKHSKVFHRYLHDHVYVFPNGLVSFSRSDIAKLLEAPCPYAPGLLFRTFKAYRIQSPEELYRTGLDGLLRCRRIGERAAWVAAVILGHCGYDVAAWCDMKRRQTRTVKGSIRLVSSQTRKQKHG